MLVEIVTPESILFEGEANSILLPGTDGGFEVLENHTALISTLDKGTIVLKKKDNNEAVQFEINAGFVEVFNNKVTVMI